ncbi:hypothetical protein BLNAU_6580 [Blattamonas nauphoetae]|uniref:Uncharacterized protein n=1 Tax=Blattamonas nauphoetae TaxID=2049346 RepID=A0ABQ9Y4A4_9EUKA|nr:hypothetical protein BLNAU_6580 [Blattamonas nauphoetae]
MTFSYLIISIVGLVGIFTMKTNKQLPVAVLVLGLLGVMVNFLGFLGVRRTTGGTSNTGIFLSVFIGGSIILTIVFLLIGIACLCFIPSANYLLTKTKEDIKKTVPPITEQQLQNLPVWIKSIKSYFIAVSVLCFLLSIASGVESGFVSRFLGNEKMKSFLLTAGSLILALLGGLAAFLLLVFRPSSLTLGTFSVFSPNVFVVAIVFSFLLVAVGALGIVSICCLKEVTCLKSTYIVSLIIVAIAFVVVLILSIVAATGVSSNVSTFCEKEQPPAMNELQKVCTDIIQNLRENRCGMLEPPLSDQCKGTVNLQEVIDIHSSMVHGWWIFLILVSSVLLLFLVFILITQCSGSRKRSVSHTQRRALMEDDEDDDVDPDEVGTDMSFSDQ